MRVRAAGECDGGRIGLAAELSGGVPPSPSTLMLGEPVPANWVSQTFDGMVLDSDRKTRSQLKLVSTSEFTVSTRACSSCAKP